MPKYKIADIIVELKLRYPEAESQYSSYLYSGNEEHEVSLEAPEEDIKYLVNKGVDITPPIAENMVLGIRFNRYLLKCFGNYIHSSALLFENKVYLFSASSGVGKSTHTKKWLKRFGDKACIINDDKPSYRIINDKCYVYGTPFAGGTDIHINTSAELGAIVFLERSEKNSIEKIPPEISVGLLMEQTPNYTNQKFVDRQLELISLILSKYPVYLLRCNLDDSAVDTALTVVDNRKDFIYEN